MESFPTIVSFYTDDEYYRKAGKDLIQDCLRLELKYDIELLKSPSKQDWHLACRHKIKFYAEKIHKHKNGILWIDVDTKLLKKPQIFANQKADMAGFLRGFQYLGDFDPLTNPRFWSPAVLYFNYNDKTKSFINFASELDDQIDEPVTDDFLLQEAWKRFSSQLNVLILSPDFIFSEDEPNNHEACFLIQRTGNVSKFIAQVKQHKPEIYSPAHRLAILESCASEATRQGNNEHAIIFLKKSLECVPTHEKTALRLARLYQKQGDISQAKALLLAYTSNPEVSLKLYQTLIDLQFLSGDLGEASSTIQTLVKTGEPEKVTFAQSRFFRLELEERAASQNYVRRKRPKLWWMESPYPGNFGDILNPYLIEKLTGIPPVFTARGVGALAIGSTIKFAKPKTIVWGTGTPRMSDSLDPQAKYLAVRGPLTRELVLRSGGTCPEIYGDPALLLPKVYQPIVSKKHKIGLIRHYQHANLKLDLIGIKEILVLRSSYSGIEKFIDEVVSCQMILSSSLHGIIVANAYGIPARWCTFSESNNLISGDGTKYKDYFLSVGLPIQEPLDLSGFDTLSDEILDKNIDQTVDLSINLDLLLEACPFNLIV